MYISHMPRPDEQFRNAIRVLNINDIQVGHVPKNVAAKLAPLLDQGKVNIEGEVLEGNRKSPTNIVREGIVLTTNSKRLQVQHRNVSSQGVILVELF